ncbi:TetR/AcrR family transcriptional regulator [Saccharopolyspora rosea]
MDPEQRREAIVRATMPLLAEHGANVTTRQIARAAGIAEGTIFRAFADKDEILHSCVTEAFRTDQLCARIRAVAPEPPLADRLTEAGVLFLDHLTQLGRMMRTLVTTGYDLHRRHHDEGRAPDDAREEFITGLVDALVPVLAPDRDRFRLPVEELARMFLSLLMGARFDEPSDDNREAAVARRVDVLLHGALGAAAGSQS